MPLSDHDRDRLVRILGLLGSDQPGERAAAALAAHRMVESLGANWSDLLSARVATPKVVVQRVREWDVDQRAAAEARIRQLRNTAERQERQIRSLRTRINSLTYRERKRRDIEAETAPD